MLRKIFPPIWFALYVAGALALHFLVPSTRVFQLPLPSLGIIVGAVVLGIGFFLSQWASKIFAEEKTEIIPTSPQNRVLVTRGPFRFSRNPMYLGITGMIVGIALMLGTLPMFVAALLYFFTMRFVFVPFEEEKMARQFGEAYAAYKARVRRWI